MHQQYFAQSNAQLVIATVKDQSTTVTSPPTLTQQCKQNADVMFGLAHEVESVAYAAVMDAYWLKSN